MTGAELRRPLSETELAELEHFLASSPGAMPLPMARGFLTGILSAPTTCLPSAWQTMLVGEPAFESIEDVQRTMGLVLRLYNEILGRLDGDGHVAPPDGADDEWIRQWCAGYLRAARMDEEWSSDTRGVGVLFPVAVLSGEFSLVGEKDPDGAVIEDQSQVVRTCRERLGKMVLELHRYWRARRKEGLAPRTARRAAKVGRNDKCPCGSGLKFKRCCALA